ncbi:MarR family transcriptional regulator [Bacillus sp. WMMC1349]|uniref:MarR family winged helix-turn-helix transcriptional regulator n=1 Tax=Bacillus sp. WMMC1349 TaxID=2736254 RepID=UPI001554DAE0|nr:MarR family transcriptional regulator [Bacillus sp. WMMC1349]NPC93760.1 MarR family transcriptional regulator [Bacillus sp. WMMC1349]
MVDSKLRNSQKHKQIMKNAANYSNVDLSSLDLFLALLGVSKKMTHIIDHYFKNYGLSEGKFTVLMLLLDAPNHTLSPTELARQSNVTKATITGLLEGLARDSYIERRHVKEDRRKVTITLTAKGKEYLLRFLPDHFDKISDLIGDNSEEENRLFIKMLEDIFEKLMIFKVVDENQRRAEK